MAVCLIYSSGTLTAGSKRGFHVNNLIADVNVDVVSAADMVMNLSCLKGGVTHCWTWRV